MISDVGDGEDVRWERPQLPTLGIKSGILRVVDREEAKTVFILQVFETSQPF